MATHDYVVANGTGAAVRADLNNALAAIVSNNSSSTEPGTTYAYQWWADTNANVLKIRNSANDGWITLKELDGTLRMEDGSAGAPALTFNSDTDTGIYRPSDNEIAVTAAGVERMSVSNTSIIVNEGSNDYDFRVESDGQTHMLFVNGGNNTVGIASSSPAAAYLHVGPGSTVTPDGNADDVVIDAGAADTGLSILSTSTGRIYFGDAADDEAGSIRYVHGDNSLRFEANSSESFRIDSSGRFLVGTSADRPIEMPFGNELNSAQPGKLVIEDSGAGHLNLIIARENQSNEYGPAISLVKSRGTSDGSYTVVQSGDNLGTIQFGGADGSADRVGAAIVSQVDTTPGSDDMPGRLLFATTSDGSGHPTERLRIDSTGIIFLGNSSSTENTIANTNQAAKAVISGGGAGCGIIEVHGASHSSDAKVISMDTDGSERLKIQANGRINMPAVYNTAVSGTIRDLFIQDTGQLGYDSSIRATKGNINLLSNVDWLYQLQPSSFNFKVRDADGELTEKLGTELQYGLIAEDVEPVAPELCFYDEVDGEQELRGVHYKKLIVPMLKALQEANAKITTLEAKVAALEAG